MGWEIFIKKLVFPGVTVNKSRGNIFLNDTRSKFVGVTGIVDVDLPVIPVLRGKMHLAD